MGIFSRLFKWRRRHSENGPVEWENTVYERDSINFHDELERERYIMNCLEQMAEAEKELQLLTGEYNLVTSYLTDIEEIEALPLEESAELRENANRLMLLEKERAQYKGRKNRMADSDFKKIESQQEEIEEGIKKIREAEKYKKVVQQDLNRLNSERHAYQYRKNELSTMLVNLKGMSTICLTALGACVMMLMVLQFGFHMQTTVGYLVAVIAATIAITVIWIKFTDAQREQVRVEKSINKLILLQNKVKIRYVNNANLLEYLLMKYQVESSEKLERLWKLYNEEKDERRQYAEAEAKLDYYKEQLVRILMRYRVKDPGRWVHQAGALNNAKEMVEIRHELIVRRQSLRKQLEYNQKNAEIAGGEIKAVVAIYPQYQLEISTMVERYEKQFS